MYRNSQSCVGRDGCDMTAHVFFRLNECNEPDYYLNSRLRFPIPSCHLLHKPHIPTLLQLLLQVVVHVDNDQTRGYLTSLN